MPTFRCLKCNPPFGVDFTADHPKCPSCGTGVAVLETVSVHFLFRQPDGPIGTELGLKYIVPCMPRLQGLSGHHATDRPAQVTCRKCRASAEYVAACKVFQDVRGKDPSKSPQQVFLS